MLELGLESDVLQSSSHKPLGGSQRHNTHFLFKIIYLSDREHK